MIYYLSMLQVNARNLDKNSFWVNTREWQLEDDSIFKGLVDNFASKAPGNYDPYLQEKLSFGHSFGWSPSFYSQKFLHHSPDPAYHEF